MTIRQLCKQSSCSLLCIVVDDNAADNDNLPLVLIIAMALNYTAISHCAIVTRSMYMKLLAGIRSQCEYCIFANAVDFNFFVLADNAFIILWHSH